MAAGEELIVEGWDDAYASILVELIRVVEGGETRRRILSLLERTTGRRLGRDLDRWWRWIWRTDPGTHPEYATFKASLYALVDPDFEDYFDDSPAATVRLDEIRWGGVVRDGMPPLDHPKMIAAAEAGYLDDGDIVFGISLDGDTRAYPRRILAWHEMFKDSIAGEHYTGVYCTLCGTMILYRSAVAGVHHELGTSGFLYRSNKLMYDHATRSLWSTLAGEPVVRSSAWESNSSRVSSSPRPGAHGADGTPRPLCCPSTRGTGATTAKARPTGATSQPTS